MADDIVERLRTVDEFSDAIGIMDAAAAEIERLRVPLTMPEWIRLGVEHGWCSEPICGMHDGLPLVDDEIERFESGDDPCFPILRLHESN